MRHAFHQLARSPGFTAVALLTLALGIGVNTAMFSLVNTLLFKAGPFPEPARLVRIYRTSPQSQTWPHSAAELVDLRTQATSLEHLTFFTGESLSFAEPGQPAEPLRCLAVSADFFPTLGVQPALGRTFTADEVVPGRDAVIVLNHGFWHRRFGADPQIVGRTLRIDGRNVTVIGIMPAGTDYPMLWGRIDVWRPLALSAEQLQSRRQHRLHAIGRLQPGVPLARARTEFNAIAARWAKDFPETSESSGLRLLLLHESTMDEVGRSLSMLVFGLGGFVLLIACANLANLQLARTAGRTRDCAIRAALGASRSRLMRAVLAESILLALAGGALGLLLAQWIADFLGRRILIGDTHGLDIAPDMRVLAFALLASLATGLLFGLLPAWTASRTDVHDALKLQSRGTTSGRAQHRLRHSLIVAEVALALALLSGAVFMVRGFQRFVLQDYGWNRDRVLTATINLPQSIYDTDEKRTAFHTRLLDRLHMLPGVEHAALASSLPIQSYNSSRYVVPEGASLQPRPDTPLTYHVAVSHRFFDTLQIQLLQGRGFPSDLRRHSPRFVIVNETLARQLWPGQSPLGQRLGYPDPDNPRWAEVIGVVRDVGFPTNLSAPDTRLQLYEPLVQRPSGYLSIVVRTAASAEALGPSLRHAVAELDPDLPAYNVRTVDETLALMAENLLLTNQLLVGFAVLGALLAAIGIYGVIANLVVQRTSEFGIRLALGAQTADILHLVLGHGLRLVIAGTVLGLAGSAALLRLCAATMPTYPGQDWLLIVIAALGLIAVALLACWLPARRATKVNPIDALRAE